MNVLGHDSALQGYTRPGTTWANEMSFIMDHVPVAGSIARPVDQQSSALPLYHRNTYIHRYIPLLSLTFVIK